MKKNFTMLFLCTMFAVAAFGQKPEAIVVKTDAAPTIDGQWDAVWDDANTYDIALPFREEVTSLGAEGDTYWAGLWDDDGIYIMVVVEDDVYFPWYVDGATSGDHWKFDQVEIYFDCNDLLEDGFGPTSGAGGNVGHYQFSADFVEGEVSGEVQINDGTEYAANVEDPNYFIEYFIPFEKLLNEYDIGVEKTLPIGFDAYVIDNDTELGGDQQRAVWTNIGGVDQAWANMDECGIILLDGAVDPTYIESIELEDATIDENNGTIMINATVLPEDATNKFLKYSLQNNANGTSGRAKVNADGSITGIIDGEVLVLGEATDGSYMSATCTLTITNQIVSRSDVNMIRNGYFDDLDEDGSPLEWNTWGDPTVVEGVYTVLPDASANVWEFRLQQQGGWGINTLDNYTLNFNLWADVSDTMNVDFEDATAPDYLRYGSSSSELTTDGGGTCDWTFVTETVPTKYSFDIQFANWAETLNEQFHFMMGKHGDGMVYIDSVELFNDADLDLITEYIEVTSIEVSGVDGTMDVGEEAQLSVSVLPTDADYPAVKWTVVNGTGYASITADGMLSADSAGIVTVVAMATDDSNVEGVLDITIGTTGITQKSVETLKVYPNPAVNELNVVLNSENSTVSIYNSVGQKMDQVVVSGMEYKFDISSYAAGIYFVKTETSIAKFVK